MKQKTILIKENKEKEFTRLLAWRFGITSDSEIDVLFAFVSYGLFAPFDLDKYLRQSITDNLGMKDNTLSVMVGRLVKKDCIKKAGKSYYLNPAFSSLDECSQIVFRFDSKDYVRYNKKSKLNKKRIVKISTKQLCLF